jgi:hypothetical protein
MSLQTPKKEYATITTQFKEGTRRPEFSVFDLDFADDISLLEGGKTN